MCGLLGNFGSRILWYTEEFGVESVTVGCPCPVAAIKGWIITPPPPCLIVDVLCLILPYVGVHYGQISPLWSCMSKADCFRSPVVCSDVILLPSFLFVCFFFFFFSFPKI